jgi:small subunit ribosomal protein S11
MTENNKIPEEKQPDLELTNKDIIISDNDDVSMFSANSSGALEELPEDVKKKLEKRKAEIAKAGKNKKKKKKIVKRVTVGKAYVNATYNNTIVTLTDINGNVLSWASAGIAGFKGPKKSTPYAAQIITRIAVEKAREVGLEEVSVYVKGVGSGRESVIRALNANGLIISSIKDTTPVPHNGCRVKKPRRV